jgi:hypothetical protein
MFAMKTQAASDSMDRSKSFASLRHLASHAKVPLLNGAAGPRSLAG